MTPERAHLETLSRTELVERARRSGAKRAEVMTRMELVDEVLRLSTPDPVQRKRARGLLGVARDLIASVVEQGLNLPDAAKLIRGDVRFTPRRQPQPPVATVTLAEIYMAQGHFDRARSILDDVLRREPEHEVAWLLRARLDRQTAPPKAKAEGDAPGADIDEGAAEASGIALVQLPTHDELVELDEPSAASGPTRALEEPVPVVLPMAVLSRRGPRWSLAWDIGSRHVDADQIQIRVVEMRFGANGLSRVDHALPAGGSAGRLELDAVAGTSMVRAAVGVERSGRFKAVAVAFQVDETGDAPRVVWTPRRVPPALAALQRMSG